MIAYLRKILETSILILVFFFFLFPVQLGPISSRNLLIVIPFVLLLFRKNFYRIPKTIFHLGVFACFVSFVSLLTALINSVYDPLYVNYFISCTNGLMVAWGIVTFVRIIHGEANFNVIAFYLMNAVLLQCIISLIMFFNSDFQSLVYGVFQISEMEQNALDKTPFRLHGVGANFFGLGVIIATVLLISTIAYKYSCNKYFKFYCTFFFVFVLVIGAFISRTIFLAIPFMLLVLMHNNRLFIYQFFSFIVKMLFIVLFAYICCNQVINEFIATYEELFNFGSKLFVDMFDDNSLGVRDVNVLFDVWIIPDTFKTFLIGDGRCLDPMEPLTQYYMHTDLGYCRQLFYFGVIGVIFWLLLYVYQSRVIIQVNVTQSKVLHYLLILMLFMNFKGIVNCFAIFSLFLFTTESQCKYLNERVFRHFKMNL